MTDQLKESRRTQKAIIKTGKYLDVMWQYYSKLTDDNKLVYCVDLDGRFTREEVYCDTIELDEKQIISIIHGFLGI